MPLAKLKCCAGRRDRPWFATARCGHCWCNFWRAGSRDQQRRDRRHGPVCRCLARPLGQVMELNFIAPAEMIRSALPLLKAGNAPIVVNVSSILGRRGIPFYSEYSASKFALQGLSESLRAEFAALGNRPVGGESWPDPNRVFRPCDRRYQGAVAPSARRGARGCGQADRGGDSPRTPGNHRRRLASSWFGRTVCYPPCWTAYWPGTADRC